MIDTTDPELLLQIAAPIVAIAFTVYWHGYAPTWIKGPRATFWNPLRRALLPALDRLLAGKVGGYAAYELDNSEFVGTIVGSIEDVEELLYEQGYERMPLAALKSLEDGRVEQASWAHRDAPFDREQTHVMLFEGTGGVDVFAHREPSAIHPATAYAHYRGRGYDVDAGVEHVREQLGDRLVF